MECHLAKMTEADLARRKVHLLSRKKDNIELVMIHYQVEQIVTIYKVSRRKNESFSLSLHITVAAMTRLVANNTLTAWNVTWQR